jgi:hypothetical protein
METRKMDESLCRSVYTLNTWTDKLKAEAKELLEQGYWVHFGSTCIGHTLSRMVENDGLNWAKSEYGDVLVIARRDGWGDTYCRLR